MLAAEKGRARTTEGSSGPQEAEAERYRLRSHQTASKGQGRGVKD